MRNVRNSSNQMPGGLPNLFSRPGHNILNRDGRWDGQRDYWKTLLARMMYGTLPPAPVKVAGRRLEQRTCHAGAALREKVRLCTQAGLEMDILVTRPNTGQPCPVFVWNQFADMEDCPVEEEACRLGYAILSFDRTQLCPDQEGAPTFDGGAFGRAYPGSDARAVGIWGWGHSIVASWLEGEAWADRHKLIAAGHSRGGKSALWAAAYDERFAVCVADGSGCAGGGCFRYMGGRLGENTGHSESLGDMLRPDRFWYWYKDELAKIGALKQEDALPFDCHTLRALIAPRALLCTEGLDDEWANGYGTQVSWRAAQEVYRFLNAGGKNALCFFEGGHSFTPERWNVALDFCEVTLRGKPQRLHYRRFATAETPVPARHFSWQAPIERGP